MRKLLPYKFTGKERDSETGLYYHGARYLNPRTSRWVSADPAMEEYLPNAGGGNEDLLGEGGVFNLFNLAVYHYAANNPVKYLDPTGRDDVGFSSLPPVIIIVLGSQTNQAGAEKGTIYVIPPRTVGPGGESPSHAQVVKPVVSGGAGQCPHSGWHIHRRQSSTNCCVK